MTYTESEVQQAIRLAASRVGARVWRNNVGACTAIDGRVIRYGLCNDSAAVNRSLKSADLIGVQPVLITPQHVGSTLGVFLSIECKGTKGRVDPAQQAWRDLVLTLGGRAAILRAPEWPEEWTS